MPFLSPIFCLQKDMRTGMSSDSVSQVLVWFPLLPLRGCPVPTNIIVVVSIVPLNLGLNSSLYSGV